MAQIILRFQLLNEALVYDLPPKKDMFKLLIYRNHLTAAKDYLFKFIQPQPSSS